MVAFKHLMGENKTRLMIDLISTEAVRSCPNRQDFLRS